MAASRLMTSSPLLYGRDLTARPTILLNNTVSIITSQMRALFCVHITHNIGFVVSLSVEFETILHEEPICQRSSGARVISMRDS